ncbi:MAG: TorF family putative porin [Proteobacteria bacterium]|nr:TorF family putative porin [Pseudomonadota bacterium]
MKKILAKQLLCLATFLTPLTASADCAPAAKTKPFYLTGSLAFTTDYLFRGQTQTFGRPAVQGALEASLYEKNTPLVGVWASNISSTEFSNSDGLEFDAYFGYKHEFTSDLSAKILAYWYLYPGAKSNPATIDPNANLGFLGGDVRNDNYNAMELIPSVSWKWFTATFAYSVTDKSGINGNFAPGWQLNPNGNSRGSWYLEGAGRFPLFDSGVALNVVYGYQKVHHYSKLSYSNYGASLDWTTPDDWYALNLKVGVSSTDNDDKYYTVTNGQGDRKDIGRTVGYFTITKSF